MLILGLETSCDETAAAIVRDGKSVLSNIVSSQHELHERYHGVVPEIASRAHLQRITPVIDEALTQARVRFDQLDGVAVGNRPGLVGSLLVGVSAAKAIAWSLGKPLIGVDHIQAHLYAADLEDHNSSSDVQASKPQASSPALGLVISGGHTSLYDIASPTQMTLLGRTIDDAVGEAYDKAATILGAGYPGGPRLDRLAQQGKPRPEDKLPRSLLGPDSLDFSFSGLKTALLYRVRGVPTGRGDHAHFERSLADLDDARRAELAAAFQDAAIDTLIIKLRRAHEHMSRTGRQPQRLIVGGGVSANSLLRRRVTELGDELRLQICLPAMTYCVDNAAMIAGLAFQLHAQRGGDTLNLPVIATTSM